MKSPLFAGLLVLFALRLLAGALLPLSADEAYYWLWARHLAAGYFDHPPAIAYLIAAGTSLFGQSEFGVRIGGILLSALTTALVWDTARVLTGDQKIANFAALAFNLSLMTTVEMLVATPDTPQMATAAAFFWTLAKLAETGNGRWWLAVGIAAGLGLLSKYSTLFLGAGALVWLIASPPMRRWLASPWPYAGGVLAFLIFTPNLLWNAQHGWATFAFQFGRIGAHQLSAKYIFEFIGAEALLATPFLLALGLLALTTTNRRDKGSALMASLFWPSVAYFFLHALHDRVQGNWPCYLIPILSVAAAKAFFQQNWTGWRAPVAKWSARLALPVAAVLVFIGYAQALLGVIPFGRKDPLARLLAVGLPDVVQKLDAVKSQNGASAIITSDYATTAWLSFYSPLPIIHVGEDYRWLQSQPARIIGPVLYVAEDRRDLHDRAVSCFGKAEQLPTIDRLRKGVAIAHYVVYRLDGGAGQPCGRMP
ncbi:4-amino-4-deoxy-L-arabinose transferase-like glycosyltransferase [Rhizomicrobium palustre]|uniref:4-amino-4-deoxy-L-arabinose transferase-like glycosyltransferase n=1 Tax=Rhizomicrobium palustre TaxID=189966 RepID=A0A846MXJ9_9PROT|nr:4-amino-4-deoxy-L-arabinose transferase-like glycosyltransferase [Rhizomicrobium palustre]